MSGQSTHSKLTNGTEVSTFRHERTRKEQSPYFKEKAVPVREGLLTRAVAFSRGRQKMPIHGLIGREQEESINLSLPTPPLLSLSSFGGGSY